MKNALGLLFGFAILFGGSLNAEAQDLEEKARELKEMYEERRAEMQKNFENSMRTLQKQFGERMRTLQEQSKRWRGERDEDHREENDREEEGGDQFGELMERMDRLEGMVEGLVQRLRGMLDRNRGGEDGDRREGRRNRERNREEDEDRREGFNRRGDFNPEELRRRMQEFMERGRSLELPEEFGKMLEDQDFEGLGEQVELWLEQLPDRGNWQERLEGMGIDTEELLEMIESQDWEGLAGQMEELMERASEEGEKWRERMEKNGNRFEFRFRRGPQRDENEDEEDAEEEEEAGLKKVPQKQSKGGECPFQCPEDKTKGDLKKRIEKILPPNQDTRFSY